ncbi:MAG: hypothetical protein A2010_18255 [Nitrospirae bacterium GWD2_57_9]|nr:MAG: hypothetical protein A2010_18255 [Nitrospirae bacterium GWD2_57_9]
MITKKTDEKIKQLHLRAFVASCEAIFDSIVPEEETMLAIVLVVLVVVLVAVFSVQNAMPVTISFLAWQFDASLAIVALLIFLTGMVAGMGVPSWMRMRRRARQKKDAAGKPPKPEQGDEL